MDDIPMEPASFPVTTLPGSPLSRHVLVTALTQRFRRMPEWNVFSGSLHIRLNDCHDAVTTHDEQWRAKYCDILKSFIQLLRQKTLLERLAGGETFASTFKELNLKLDDICVGVERNDIAGKAHWMEDWERGWGFQAETLRQLVSEAAPGMLIGEIRGEKLVTKIMLDLFMWPEGNKSGQLRELKQQTLDRLRIELKLETRVITSVTVKDLNTQPIQILSIFRWFTPERNVEFVDDIGSGSCGIVTRAKWRNRDGNIQDVIVKTMFDESIGTKASFLRQLQFWYDLPSHPNVVQLYAGCHLAQKPFFVCEDAHGGDITQFFEKKENRGIFWNIFLQAAEGLQFLHKHRIIHDALKGSNILIGAKNTPKISDFNCAQIRTLSARLSARSTEVQEKSVRWKPRERLNEKDDNLLYFRSDIYSLGMTMIEALSQDIPFGTDVDDNEAMKKIIRGEEYERPTEATEEEWAVISKLIAVNIEDRPKIDEVITLIRNLISGPNKLPQHISADIAPPMSPAQNLETHAPPSA